MVVSEHVSESPAARPWHALSFEEEPPFLLVVARRPR
jgi:hypothetical protein